MNLVKQYIDFTNLDINASEEEIILLAKTAIKEGFHSICIRATHLNYLNSLNLNCRISIVIGFPKQKYEIETIEELNELKKQISSVALETKIQETIFALEHNADELDPVIDISDFNKIETELKELTNVLYNHSKLTPGKTFWLKPIFSCEILTNSEIEHSIGIFSKIVTEFYTKNFHAKDQIKFAYKNSTGYISSSKLKLKTTSTELISLITSHLDKYDPEKNIFIKAAGGIRDVDTAETIINAAKHRLSHIGTSRILKIASSP